MAKVNIEFDTKTKDISVSFDGKKIDNVYSVNLSKSYYNENDNENAFGLSLMTLDSSKQEDEGYRAMQQIVAKESAGANEASSAGAVTHPDHPDFLLLKKASTTVSQSIANYLKSRRGSF